GNLYKSGNRLLLAGECKEKMYFISGSDFGKTVVAALKTDNAVNIDYDVQGPEAYTADQAVQIFKDNYTKEKLKISKAPFAMLKMLAPFSTKINYGRHILEALNNYPEKFTSENTWKDLHKPVTTVKDYVSGLNSKANEN
ncbi:MAG: NmrA family transcriptional regulator, partial [Bacteroidia bacterium]|nr:NmrA family transcriptional regulator [Bacteroidia bacterium]